VGAISTCQNCGAPWKPDVTGACGFCGVVAPPPDAPAGVAGARPTIDANALYRLLISVTTDPGRPLDRLATALKRVGGDRVTFRGNPVALVQLDLEDWEYRLWIDHGDAQALAIHTVRGVVLKHQSLPFDECLAALSGHLAEYAGTHRHVYDAIVALSPDR
jgi:hypothetical protein